MKEWFAGLRQNPRALYGVGGGAIALLIVTVGTLWIAGAFGGGEEDTDGTIACMDRVGEDSGCPSPTARAMPTRASKRTPTASLSSSTTTATPTPSGATGAATPVFRTPTPTGTPQPTAAPTPAPTLAPYRLIQDVSTATFARMVDFAMIPGRPDEAVVVTQQEARLRRVSLSGAFAPTDYGNLSGRVKTDGDEEGLLSLAFSPAFTIDRYVYVYYTSKSCPSSVTRCVRLSRFQVVADAMNTSTETVVLEVNQQLNASNHNGGRILFGPDGKLYVSIGDGGGVGDPLETGQNKSDLLGNVLRIDVTGQTTYVVPADNPFVNAAGADEVWAHGLRNPWRFSFDRATNLLWLGDVGQNRWEEVDVIERGANYGWDCFEGFVQYEPVGCNSDQSMYQFPRAVYDHAGDECAVTGGYVYRGTAMPELSGRYIYGDYCSGKIWALDSGNTNMPTPVLLLHSDKHISSFAELPNGELLLLTFENAIYRLTR